MSSGNTDNLIGKALGDYVIKRLIAKGGMGRVYEAEDRQLGRRVAIKIITLGEDAAEDLVQRFEREARVISQLDAHPNIVTIYRYGREAGVTYFAMQYVDGDSLSTYIQTLQDANKYMDSGEVIHILRQVAAALDHAHAQGIIHRDVKPANIMLQPDPSLRPIPKRAILMDFGLVMSIDNTMTAGTAFGTPRYIAPEQAISSAQACPQSDVYSLGVVSYEMLTGKPPFDDDDTPISVALSHVTKEPPSPRVHRPDLPPAVEPVMKKVLEKKPVDRYQSASEFVSALEVSLLGEAFTGKIPVASRAKAPVPSKKVQAEPLTMPGGVFPVEGETRRDHMLPSLVLATVFIALAVVIYVIFFQNGGATDDSTVEDSAGSVTATLPADSSERPSETPIPATDEPTTPPPTEETTQPTAMLESASTEVVMVTAGGNGNGSLELVYSSETLILHNLANTPLQLLNVELRQGDSLFSLGDFGVSILGNWGAGGCSYVTLLHTEIESLPDCESQYPPLRYLNPKGFVWAGSEGTFEVYQNGQSLGICDLADGKCRINGIQQVSG